jgi:hypothetical protein
MLYCVAACALDKWCLILAGYILSQHGPNVRVKERNGNLMQGNQGKRSVYDACRSIMLFRDKMGVCADERGTD